MLAALWVARAPSMLVAPSVVQMASVATPALWSAVAARAWGWATVGMSPTAPPLRLAAA
jgi:hypothetical protein